MTPCDLLNADMILRESGTPMLIETGFPSSLIRLESKSVLFDLKAIRIVMFLVDLSLFSMPVTPAL